MTTSIIFRKKNIFPGFECVGQCLTRDLCMVTEDALLKNLSSYLGVPLPTWEEFYEPSQQKMVPKRPLSVDAEGKVTTLWAAVTQGSGPCIRFGRDQEKRFVTLCICKGRAQSPRMSNSGSSVNPILGTPVFVLQQTFACKCTMLVSCSKQLTDQSGVFAWYPADKHRVLCLTDTPSAQVEILRTELWV